MHNWHQRSATEEGAATATAWLAGPELLVGESLVVGPDVFQNLIGDALAAVGRTQGVCLAVVVDDEMEHRSGRPFDRVIVESISRLSRNSSVAFRLEEEFNWNQAPLRGRAEDVEAALSRLPVIAEDLAAKPQPVLRQLFEA